VIWNKKVSESIVRMKNLNYLCNPFRLRKMRVRKPELRSQF